MYFSWNLCTFLITSCSVLLRMRNFSEKFVEKIKTHILYSITFSENNTVYEIMWKKYGRVKKATDGNIIWRMRISCWMTKATDIHSEYVILIAFPRQKLLHERALILRLYVHCLPYFLFHSLSSKTHYPCILTAQVATERALLHVPRFKRCLYLIIWKRINLDHLFY
jgi:hypothetical protein